MKIVFGKNRLETFEILILIACLENISDNCPVLISLLLDIKYIFLSA